MLGSLIPYLRGVRIMMFQLSGFDCNPVTPKALKQEVITTSSNPKAEGLASWFNPKAEGLGI